MSPITNLKTKNLEKKNLQSSKLKLKTDNIILKDSFKIKKKINKTTKFNELNKPTNIKKKIKNDFNYLNDLTKNINSLISEFKKNEINLNKDKVKKNKQNNNSKSINLSMTNLNKENEILNEEKKDEDQIIKNDIELNEEINNFKNNISEMEKLILQRESYQSQIDSIFNSN